VDFIQKTQGIVLEAPRVICAILDWMVKVVERLLVLGVAWMAFFFGYHFCRGSLPTSQREVIEFVAQNWKIVPILMIPLFYQTVRTFLEEVQEAWGIKRTPKQVLPTEAAVLPNLHASAELPSAPEEEE